MIDVDILSQKYVDCGRKYMYEGFSVFNIADRAKNERWSHYILTWNHTILSSIIEYMKTFKTVQIGPWKCRRIIEVEEFSGFPRCIAQMIAEYCMIPTLLPWIDTYCIDWESLGENPRSIEAGLIDERICNAFTVSNPEIAEYIKKNIENYFPLSNQPYIWENPALFDWLRERYPDEYVDIDALSMNTNPNVIKYIKDNKLKVTNVLSSNNPIALEYFCQIMDQDAISKLYGNTAATDYLGDFTGHGDELSGNSHPRAIEYLRTHQDEIDWTYFSANPGIFEYKVDPDLLTALSE